MPTLPSKNDTTEVRLAINLFDLHDRVPVVMRQKLLAGRLDLKRHIDMRFDRAKEADEAAVVFVCPLLEAAIICDWIRSNDRASGDYPTRLYIKRKVSWTRIPSYVILTEVGDDGKCRLNPEEFSGFSGSILPLVAPKVKGPVILGTRIDQSN